MDNRISGQSLAPSLIVLESSVDSGSFDLCVIWEWLTIWNIINYNSMLVEGVLFEKPQNMCSFKYNFQLFIFISSDLGREREGLRGECFNKAHRVTLTLGDDEHAAVGLTTAGILISILLCSVQTYIPWYSISCGKNIFIWYFNSKNILNLISHTTICYSCFLAL